MQATFTKVAVLGVDLDVVLARRVRDHRDFRPSQRYRPSLHLGCALRRDELAKLRGARRGELRWNRAGNLRTFGSCSVTGSYSSAGPSHRPMENIRPRTLLA